jgi:hypothetical protein
MSDSWVRATLRRNRWRKCRLDVFIMSFGQVADALLTYDSDGHDPPLHDAGAGAVVRVSRKSSLVTVLCCQSLTA